MNKWVAISMFGFAASCFASGEVQTVKISIQNNLQQPLAFKEMTINQDTHIRRYPSAEINSSEIKNNEVVVFSPTGATARSALNYEVELQGEQCEDAPSCIVPIQLFWATNMGPGKDADALGNGHICGSAPLDSIRISCPVPYPNQLDPSVLEITFSIEERAD